MANRKGIDHDLLTRRTVVDPWEPYCDHCDAPYRPHPTGDGSTLCFHSKGCPRWGVPSAVADLYDEDDVTEDLPMIPVDLVRMSTQRYVGSYTPFGRVRTWLAIVLARLSLWVAP